MVEGSLFQSYQGRLIIRWALVEGAVLFAVVAFLVTQQWWVLPILLVFMVAGFVPAAPSRSSVERTQQEIIEHGTPLSLLDVLQRPVPR